jgi:hypothetical protein
MKIVGHIQNGVVVLDGGASLPEGTRVWVSTVPPGAAGPQIVTKAGQFPVVQGGVPGSVELTNERIHEILEEEDIDALTGQWNVPS